ncbi:MAG: hypothetical protein ACPGRW_05970 [Flavobacteriaceae bacterium]
MYTQLVKIAEHGLKGETEKVEQYVRHFVKMHKAKQHLVNSDLDSSLSKKFEMLLNNEEGSKVTMD